MYLQVNDAEPPADEHELALDLVGEIPVPGGAHVKTLLDTAGQWLLLDERGRLLRVDLPQTGHITKDSVAFTTLVSFHAAGVTQLLPDAAGRCAVSASLDGSVWAHNLDANTRASSRRFPAGVTCMVEAPASASHQVGKSRAYLLGHADGTLRRVVRCADGWRMTHALKPHKHSVAAICIAPSGDELATVSDDGTVFFFELDAAALTPRALVTLAKEPAAALWLQGGLVVGCTDGALLRVTPPGQHSHEAAGTYACDAQVEEWAFQPPAGLLQPQSTPQESDPAEDQGVMRP